MIDSQASAAPLKVGLVGVGGIARLHLPAFREAPGLLRLSAVVDPAPAVRAAAGKAFETDSFENLDAMLATADIDAVDICTPHHLHLGQAIAAAEAGKHVLIEKPLACSMRECRAIVEACARNGVKLMVAQQLRHVPSYRGARAMIKAGRLGRIWGGRIEEFLSVSADRTPSHQPRWYNDANLAGGGVAITQSTHHIDLFRYLLGDVARVSARVWSDHPNYRNGAEDSVMATLVFENGCQVQLSASNSARITRFGFELFGEEGFIFTHCGSDAGPVEKHQAPAFAILEAGSQGAPVPAEADGPPQRSPFISEIIHFAECCRSGDEPISSGLDNLGTMQAVFAMYASARRGGAWVDVSDL